jgi:DNA processing protein
MIASLFFSVVVIEASKNSGSLTPARCASQQECEVFPGPESSLAPWANGTNQLLRGGANWVEDAYDVIFPLPKT